MTSVLLIANDFNPEWPSLPIVAFKFARAIATRCQVTVVTQIRNQPNLQKIENGGLNVSFVDTEYLAAPIYRVSNILRGGSDVAWSTNMILEYPTYVEFERQIWKKFRSRLAAGEFDIVHRLTPMSPTMPSYIAGRLAQPFVLGPLNGNLDWPPQFRAEQAREKERARILRGFYKRLPFSRSTYAHAACILAGFQHTIDDIEPRHLGKTVMFPEVGYDAEVFHAPAAERAEDRPLRFLFAGRLVPYKLPEVAIRAVAGSDMLRRQELRIIGDGPEAPRLGALIEAQGLGGCVRLEGRKSQAEVAQAMRDCDVFVFPSIRELGAGVVVEAMASRMACIAVDYGAPGALIDEQTGYKAPLDGIDGLVAAFRARMEACVTDRAAMRRKAEAAERRMRERYEWRTKAAQIEEVYDWVLGRRAEKPSLY